MTVKQAIDKVVKLAEEQVGYKATSDKHTKYTADLDALGDFYNGKKQWSGGAADWCDIFYDWLIVKSFGAETGRKMLYQPKRSTGAGCNFSAGFYRQNNAWSKTPQIGSQIFYGRQGNEQHTGIVIKIDGEYIWTVEGNTGGGAGQVQRKKVSKNSNISGYGIPNWSLVADVKEEPVKKPEAATNEYKAIDVSEFNDWIDWKDVKNDGIYAAMIRVGGRFSQSGKLYTDSMFDDNIVAAKKVGIKTGMYFFSQAITVKEATEEADFAIKMAKAYSVDQVSPIFIDTEFYENARHNNISKELRTDICKTFCDRVKAAGYNTGVYTGYYWLRDNLISSQLKNYDIWLAEWGESKHSVDNVVLWQYSSTGKVAGIKKEVDLDKGYKDYWKEKKPVESKPEQPKLNTNISKLVEDGIFGALSTKAAQIWLNCSVVDGIISGQVKSMQRYMPSVKSVAWGIGGSAFIKKLQLKVGAESDGYVGPKTVKALQKFLNRYGFRLTVDGIWGPSTSKAFQRFLNNILALR